MSTLKTVRSHAIAANIGEVRGYLIYSILGIDPDMNLQQIIIDPGNGKTLLSQKLPMWQVNQMMNPMMGPMGMNQMMGPMGMNPMMGPMGMNPMMGPMGMNPMMGPMGMNPMMGPMGMNPMMGPMGMNPMMGHQ